MLASLATVTTPVATFAVIREYRAKGPFTSTLLGAIALDDIWCITAVGISVGLVLSMGTDTNALRLSHLLPPLWEVTSSIGIGLLVGIAAVAVLGRIHDELEILAFVSAVVFLSAGIGRHFDKSALLITMTSGVIISNFYRDDVLKVINRIDLPVLSRQADPSDLGRYVTERGNPSNRLGVRVTLVRLPAPLLSRGLRLIDTPGVGSVYLHNTDTAYAFIPHVDAAVFLFTADPPVSAAELEFVKDLREEVQRVFFIQNKVDQVPLPDRRESLEFSRRQLAEALGGDSFEVFPLSAREGLEAKLRGQARRLADSGLLEFERALEEFAGGERSAVAVEAALRTAGRLAAQQHAAIAVERAAIAVPLEELERKRTEFDAHLQRMRRARDDSRHLLRAAGARLVAQVVDADLKSLQERVRPRLRRELQQVARAAEDASGRELLDQLNAFTRNAIEQVYAEWMDEEEARVTEALGEAVDRFVGQINEALRDLARISAELFHADVGELAVSAELSGTREFYFAPWQMTLSPDTLSASLLYVLPARWVRNSLLRASDAKLIEQLGMHGGRVRYDFVRRLEASIREFENRVVGAMDLTIAAIERAIDRAVAQKRARGDEVASRERELAMQQAALAEATRNLDSKETTRLA